VTFLVENVESGRVKENSMPENVRKFSGTRMNSLEIRVIIVFGFDALHTFSFGTNFRISVNNPGGKKDRLQKLGKVPLPERKDREIAPRAIHYLPELYFHYERSSLRILHTWLSVEDTSHLRI